MLVETVKIWGTTTITLTVNFGLMITFQNVISTCLLTVDLNLTATWFVDFQTGIEVAGDVGASEGFGPAGNAVVGHGVGLDG